MECIVVDASVAVKWFVPEVHVDRALRILQDFADGKLRLISPDIIVGEVGNALWKRSVLLGHITVAEAQDDYRRFLALGIERHSSLGLAPLAFKLATDERRPI